ncbi:MAG: helix-turn-helix transcriptional regulator [Saprospiraceae bacterium]|nr:helix-turn-helix transcriptional regulator [Saprospiraceae bacterium]
MKQALSDTEIRIIAAAERIFLMGLDGARMQDIADEASINKAMLHYYFRNKQQLLISSSMIRSLRFLMYFRCGTAASQL